MRWHRTVDDYWTVRVSEGVQLWAYRTRDKWVVATYSFGAWKVSVVQWSTLRAAKAEAVRLARAELGRALEVLT